MSRGLSARQFRNVPYLVLKDAQFKWKLSSKEFKSKLHCEITSSEGDSNVWCDLNQLLPKGTRAIVVTQSAAEAFGEDLADDSYSVSELSHYDEERQAKKQQSSLKGKQKGKTKAEPYSRRIHVPSLNRQESIQHESTDGDEKVGAMGSAGSPDHSQSDDTSFDSSDDADITITTFASFAKLRFQMKTPHTYSCSALPQPLLPKSDKADYLASLVAWVTLLRIMGDLPDVDLGDALIVSGTSLAVSSRIKMGFTTKYTKKDIDDFHRKYSELFKDPTGADTSTMPFLLGCSDTMLEKVQFICAVGIYKPNIRDELYCQLCKQLTNNPSRNSIVRGWVLMSLMVSSFAPSEKFATCLSTFLRDGPVEFCEKIDRHLHRTCCIGTRGYPPSWLEFQAAKNGKPLLVPVTFMNGHRMLCEMDGATTVAEVVSNVSQRLGIKDTLGYSVFIVLHSKISCLGSGQHRVMDAISECEQHGKQLGMRESSTAWRIFLRKEFFSPWYSTSLDPICTDLVYQQVKRGITMGEYRLDKEDTLLRLAALIYYIEHPNDETFHELIPFVNSFIPENVQERRPEGYYNDRVKSDIENSSCFKDKATVNSVKEKVVQFALDEFSILFSRFYDMSKISSPNVQMVNMVVGINNKGIIMIDADDKPKMALDFCDIIDIYRTSSTVSLKLLHHDIEMKTHHAEDFYLLVMTFIGGLKARSKMAFASQDFTSIDDPVNTGIVKGDLLELMHPIGPDFDKNKTVKVRCKRTGKNHEVPCGMVYILATLMSPSKETLSQFSLRMRKGEPFNQVQKENSANPSLQNFAKHRFRQTSDNAVSKFLNKASFKKDRGRSDNLWQYTKETLKKPLLKKTCNREDIRKLACHCFTSIQTYMANLIINDDATNYNLCVDWILEPARRNKYMREEIYCQIIKQLTNNPDKTLEDRGWVLLSLLTSLTVPSRDLYDEVLAFVSNSHHNLAQRCKENFKKIKTQEVSRLYSSHFLEHQMVINQQPNVRVQIAFPNHTIQTIEVTSFTRVHEIKKEIAGRLHLKSYEEYGLFLTFAEKVYCLQEKAFYFDSISHASSFWFKGIKRHSGRNNSQSTPLLVMLKKIWVNGTPGKDSLADTMFHFTQEVPNFLRDYHQTNPQTTAKLAACIYKTKFGDSLAKLSNLNENASEIVPSSFLKFRSPEDASEILKQELAALKNHSSEDVKRIFLDEMSSLITYGAVFFEVKQRHSTGFPKFLLIAINFTGVHIIDADSKAILKSYEFYCIPNWAYDDMSFTFIFSDGNGTSKFLVETKVGHNIDDLLMSYVAWIMNYQMRKRYGYIGNTAGESIC